jgi:hypothetical protein
MTARKGGGKSGEGDATGDRDCHASLAMTMGEENYRGIEAIELIS